MAVIHHIRGKEAVRGRSARRAASTGRRAPLFALAVASALTLLLGQCWSAVSAADDNLPVYTSPIDVTGLRLQVQASVPDRDTGQRITTPAPPGLFGPKFNQLMATPLSSQFDEFWNVTPDPKTGKTARQRVCDGIHDKLFNSLKTSGGISLYNFDCNLATTGTLLASQNGSTLTLGYTLFDSSLHVSLTTPWSCREGSVVCPADPSVNVSLVPQVITTVQVPGICQITARSDGAVIQSPDVEFRGLAAPVQSIGDLFTGGSITTKADEAIRDMAGGMAVPLPLDDALAELRNNPACTTPTSPQAQALASFTGLDTDIEPSQSAIFLRLTHKPLAAPVLPYSDQPASTPSFTRPSIAAPPTAAAGSTIKVTGRFFPQTADPDRINLQINHSACHGTTDLDWGPAGGATNIDEFSYQDFSCTTHHELTNLSASTPYRFRARDCDPVTCSAWSDWVTVTTGAASTPAVALTLDGAPLATATASPQGTFDVDVVIPTGTPPGDHHVIRAASGDAADQTTLQVTQGGSSAKPMLVLTGTFYGDTGCPVRPLPNPAIDTDTPFSALGTGFAPGTMSLYLDSATGTSLGSASVAADGTFCDAAFNGPPVSQLGNHTLVAVQDGTVKLTTPVQVFQPEVIH